MTLDHLIAGVCATVGGASAQFFVNRKLRRFLRIHLEGIYHRLGRLENRLNVTPSPIPNTDPGQEFEDNLLLAAFDATNHGYKPGGK